MSTLTEKARKFRSTLPKSGGGKAPEDSGIRLATFPRPEGELRLSWNVYEDRPYLRLQLWSKSDDGSFWPVKGQGFTIRVKDLPDLAEGSPEGVGHGPFGGGEDLGGIGHRPEP